jgi:biopolymer transport protein ExbD
MKINPGNINEEPRIELVPLIDVIFCILTFFLLAGLQVARQQAINVDIPKATTGAPAARELLMVSINDSGQLFLEKQPMLVPGQLVEAVKQYRQARPNSSIVLYASKQVSYSKVVEVLDALRGVAGDRVALATLPANTAAPTPPTINPAGSIDPANPTNPTQGINPLNPYQPAPATSTPSPTTAPAPGATNPPAGSSAQPPQTTPSPVTPTTTPVQTSPATVPSKAP